MDAHVETLGTAPDGTQTRGLKGLSYDWERLLVPTGSEFDSGLVQLIEAASVAEPSPS